MLPYLAQGANSALEDGAIFSALLGEMHRNDRIAAAMAMYEKIRKPRVQSVVEYTFVHSDEFNLIDGVAQRERDALLARSFRQRMQSMATSLMFSREDPLVHECS